MRIQVPEKVNYIIQTLLQNGQEAYAVGGCVRDALLGRIPEDWDITTSAKPEEVKALFRRTIDTGIQHGTVTVMLDKDGFEVTTYRVDGEYEDNRHPKSVSFTTSLLEDLKRRDFTINAMAYNEIEGMVDAFNGIGDLERGIIRCVGNAQERFQEDALRMLRAVRFSGQLDFEIEENTKQAILEQACSLEKISAERIRVELDKLLCSNHPMRLLMAQELGMTQVVFPEFDSMLKTEQDNPHHCYNVGVHALKSVEYMNQFSQERNYDKKLKSVLAWTAMLHDVGKPKCKSIDEQGIGHFYEHQNVGKTMAREILRRLRFDNYTIDLAARLIEWHDYRLYLTKKAVRKGVNKIGEDIIWFLFMMQKADILAQSSYQRAEKLQEIEKAEALLLEIQDQKECMSLKNLAINGSDLIALGFAPGRNLGIMLQQLLEQVLEEPSLNQKETLLKISKKQLEE